jgi:DNA-binding NarL/FixJ family response regulator
MLHCNISSRRQRPSAVDRSIVEEVKMPRSGKMAEWPRRGQSLVADQRSTGRRPDCARATAGTGALDLPASASPARCDLIDITMEIARRTIEVNALRLSMEFVDRQRNVIDSIHESTIAALRLAEAISQAAGQAEATDAGFRHRRERSAAVHNGALNFFHSAMSLIGVIASAGPAARDPDTPVHEDARASQTVAGCVAALTLQQRRVLSLLLSGLPNKLIAHELGVTEATVKAHVSQVLLKFKVHSRARVIAEMSRAAGLEG